MQCSCGITNQSNALQILLDKIYFQNECSSISTGIPTVNISEVNAYAKLHKITLLEWAHMYINKLLFLSEYKVEDKAGNG